MIRRPPRSTRTTHAFPTRRSSDLHALRLEDGSGYKVILEAAPPAMYDEDVEVAVAAMSGVIERYVRTWPSQRSEEHTYEIQSLMRISYAVFCLKKNNSTRTEENRSALQNKINRGDKDKRTK